MITATIQSIVISGTNISVVVAYSNTTWNTYTFTLTDTPTSIQARIQADLDDMNAVNYQLETITSALSTGTVFQTSGDSLKALQDNIDTKNSAAASAILVQQVGTALPANTAGA